MGYFPVDSESVNYLRATGRTEEQCEAFEAYFRAQEMFGMPAKGQIDYSVDLEVDLSSVQPGVAGPKRPQDRINVPELKHTFLDLLAKPIADGGYNKPAEHRGAPATINVQHPRFEIPADEQKQVEEMEEDRPTPDRLPTANGAGAASLDHGSVVIAAITSCTNTSNPSVMLGAGLLAKKAVERGLHVSPAVKTSLAPGSRVVQDYLSSTKLQPYLDQLGCQIVGYGCTTCIGNSGPLPSAVEEAIAQNDLVVASVLSGNRNFEARVHQNVKANFLMSPPLVVAFALAGRVDIDLTTEPIGTDQNGQPVFLRDLWPSLEEIRDAMQSALKPEIFRKLYRD
jgi:aconitate hydratase